MCKIILVVLASLIYVSTALGQEKIERPAYSIGDAWNYCTTDDYTKRETSCQTETVKVITDKDITLEIRDEKGVTQKKYSLDMNLVESPQASYSPYFPVVFFPLFMGGRNKMDIGWNDSGYSGRSEITNVVTGLENFVIDGKTCPTLKIEQQGYNNTGSSFKSTSLYCAEWKRIVYRSLITSRGVQTTTRMKGGKITK